MPDFKTMIIVSVLALIVNVFGTYHCKPEQSKEAHIRGFDDFHVKRCYNQFKGLSLQEFWSIG